MFALNKAAAELARRAADDFTRRNPDKPRFVAGSIGPTNKQLSMGIHVEDPGRRDITFDQMVANYTEQIRGLVAGGVDILLTETAFDTLVMKASLFAMDAFFEQTGTRLPVMISGTIFADGRTLSAQPIESFYYSVSHIDAISVGLNCAVGVDLMRGPVERLSGICRTPSVVIPMRECPTGLAAFWATGTAPPPSWANLPKRLAQHRGGAAARPRNGSQPSLEQSTGCRRAPFPRCRTGRRTAGWSRSWSALRPTSS